MGKIQFCRICRTETNLKFSAKQLREFNKKQLALTQETIGSDADKASRKLQRTTPTLGNICNDCNDRIQIFHRLDDINQCSDSDMEIDVVSVSNAPQLSAENVLSPLENNCRPDTPIIVDDDDMLYNIFMQKVDLQRQQRQQSPPEMQLAHRETQPQIQPQLQQFTSNFNPPCTPPQSNVGSEGDDTKIIEVLASRESTPASIDRNATPVQPAFVPHEPGIVDEKGHRIVAIIDLDDEDDSLHYNQEHGGVGITEQNNAPLINLSAENNAPAINLSTENNAPLINLRIMESPSNMLNFVVAAAKYQTENLSDGNIIMTPCISTENKQPGAAAAAAAAAAVANIVDDDDEEIVFRRVDPPEVHDPPPPKKRNRKIYDHKELRLVASLSLLSSDSESEEVPTSITATRPPTPPKRFECKQCKICFPDEESISVHNKIHQGIKCPVCKFGYAQEQRLIHHMRCKHRTFNGPELSEKPRASQDSAMTIRLRYMQRKTFYECQLCGRIDMVFKEHKEHIIYKHPVESKKLNDPILKELKCPVCHCKCGTKYLTLCRHLIGTHKSVQYKSHLKELLHASAFGWSSSRQQEVSKTARIYQFVKRSAFYFECKTCHKVMAGYLNHLKHINTHANEKPIAKPPHSDSSDDRTSVLTATKIGKHAKNLNISKNRKLAQVLRSTKVHNKIKHNVIQKVDKTSTELRSSASIKKTQISQKPLKSTTSPQPIANNSRAKVCFQKPKDIKEISTIFKKPKSLNITSKQNKKLINNCTKPIAATATSKGKRKGGGKEDLKLPKSKFKIVKVKPAPVKLINLQTYKCKYCPRKLRGFRIYNLHLLKEHKDAEFQMCLKCHRKFSADRFLLHTNECTNISGSYGKQRRKCVKPLQTDAISCSTPNNIIECKDCTKETTNTSTAVCEHIVPEPKRKASEMLPAVVDVANRPMWLNDLLNMKVDKNNRLYSKSSRDSDCSDNHNRRTDNRLASISGLYETIPLAQGTVQCCYCMHLFKSDLQMQQHVQQQHSKTNMVLIKYKAPLISSKSMEMMDAQINKGQ